MVDYHCGRAITNFSAALFYHCLSGTVYILDSSFNSFMQDIASYLALAPWVLNMHNVYPSYVRWVSRVVELGAIPQNCGLFRFYRD